MSKEAYEKYLKGFWDCQKIWIERIKERMRMLNKKNKQELVKEYLNLLNSIIITKKDLEVMSNNFTVRLNMRFKRKKKLEKYEKFKKKSSGFGKNLQAHLSLM